ncbi:carbohydrate-binding family 9-like protein [Arenibacter sp. 6A1]|uniref:carbohydrate-binding family 9-like protein n=1 Tax=Arenibacter sp. 6A1 TaxID=2720391 RepID=UPI00144785DA|nr:carbohydrate-binding family 9-like protein [Arenibacter sp. 6A1]NKI25726.1 carbohydrate-binding family 9-like protein [Arenibacter sp. 6A1]
MKLPPLKYKKLSLLIVLLMYVGCVVATSQVVPRSYVAFKATEPLVIDGKADEAAWKNSEWSQDYIDIEGKKEPTYKTRMKMLWDNEYLYFMAKMEEPHVWATLKQRDTVIFYNNDFEIFIDPDGDTHNYYEYEMNAHNTLWDLFLTKPYRNNGKVIDSWDIQGVKSAVSIQGTLNDSSDLDEEWVVEIAIPWAVITEASNSSKVPENDFWRLNFSRVNWDFDLTDGRYSRKKDESGKFLPEYNWVWSPQGVINMHEPEHWGYVYFSSENPGGKADFTIPKDDHIKWYMYELYRGLLHGKKGAEKSVSKPKQILGSTIKPTLEKHSFGWNIWVKSPFTENVLVIKEDGKFESIEKK